MFASQQTASAHRRRSAAGTLHPHENTDKFWQHVSEGTALPQPNVTTNDSFKVKFEYVAYTGHWWDTTIQTAGVANGVLKAFLLQSGLSPTITHYQFFERLFSRYFTRKRGKVYGGPNSAADHKNAWNTPVLNKDMKMFEWMCMPAVTPQQAVTGISVNLSMRLVRDWCLLVLV